MYGTLLLSFSLIESEFRICFENIKKILEFYID